MSLHAAVLRWYYEGIAKGKSYEQWLQRLQRNQTTIYTRMLNATDFPYNHKSSAHIIGIERWSAHRLRVLLGEPLVMDEYDGYAPSHQLSMAELAEQFKETRSATLALVRKLQSNGVALTQTVPHNEIGDLSLRGWLFYVENHGGRETVLMVQHLRHRVKPALES